MIHERRIGGYPLLRKYKLQTNQTVENIAMLRFASETSTALVNMIIFLQSLDLLDLIIVPF